MKKNSRLGVELRLVVHEVCQDGFLFGDCEVYVRIPPVGGGPIEKVLRVPEGVEEHGWRIFGYEDEPETEQSV